MIGLQIVPLAGVAPRPWRNGGGVAQDLLAWPAGGDAALLVSVAQIEATGPFSSYPGMERWFAVAQGAGVELQVDGRTHVLGPGSEPLRFDGAAAPACRLRDGPSVALNLMFRGQAGRGAMQRARPGVDWHGSGTEWRALYTAGPARLHVDGEHVAELAAAALVWHPFAAGQCWAFHPAVADTPGWWLSFQPQGAQA